MSILKKYFKFSILIMLIFLMCSCSNNNNESIEDNNIQAPMYDSIESLSGKTIGCVTGSIFDQIVQNNISDAYVEYYGGETDCVTALNSNKVDAIVSDKIFAENLCEKNSNLKMIDKSVGSFDYGLFFQKGSKYVTEFNKYLSSIKQSGEYDKLYEIYYVLRDESVYNIHTETLNPVNGTITFATCSSSPEPLTYVRDNKIYSFEIALMEGFCRENGYGIEIVDTDVSSIIIAVSSGAFDSGGAYMSITDERKESIDFSDPILSDDVVLVVNNGIQSSKALYNSYEELDGKKIGVRVGTIMMDIVEDNIKDADLQYYTSTIDMAIAVDAGKIDAFGIDEPIARYLCNNYKNLAISDIYVMDEDLAYAFPKSNNELCNQVNEFIKKNRKNGTLSELDRLWISESGENIDFDINDLENINGVIRLGVNTAGGEPMCYVRNNKIVGYDVDLMYRFCKEYGYKLEILDFTFDGMLAAIQSEKVDVIGSALTVTEERKEAMLFSEPDYISKYVIITGKANMQDDENVSFITSLKESFEKTFIKENRYKLFIQGIGTTLLISICSILFGTILGFIAYLLCKDGSIIANKIMSFYSWLLQGMPTVLHLMILFYLIFGDSKISSVVVSIIGFTMLFLVSVYSILNTAISSIDKGQYEAAYALGYTKNQTFFKIILPQSLSLILPPYKGEIVSLLKATSVVGYIAVQDLTKMTDIVRSRTFESFFPLIVAAIIYYILAYLLTYFVKKIQFNVDPTSRRKDKILKGIKR